MGTDTFGGRCPAGYYCPNGTVVATANPCPIGRFSSVQGRYRLEHCNACSPGFFCNRSGLANPVGPCRAGYYCTSGARSAIPPGGQGTGEGGVCAAGTYCPAGSS